MAFVVSNVVSYHRRREMATQDVLEEELQCVKDRAPSYGIGTLCNSVDDWVQLAVYQRWRRKRFGIFFAFLQCLRRFRRRDGFRVAVVQLDRLVDIKVDARVHVAQSRLAMGNERRRERSNRDTATSRCCCVVQIKMGCAAATARSVC
jgi:hypothetical protein